VDADREEVVRFEPCFYQVAELACFLRKSRIARLRETCFMTPDGSVAHSNVTLDFYSQRPLDLEDLSQFEFISHFQRSKVVSPPLKLVAEGSPRYAANDEYRQFFRCGLW